MGKSKEYIELFHLNLKRCSRCKNIKNLIYFSRRGLDKYRASCKQCDSEANKIYETNNRNLINFNRRERRKDPLRNILLSQRDNQRRLFKNKYKNYKSSALIREWLGATLEEVRLYLEKQFVDEMNWDNRGMGENKWQIDHKIPISLTEIRDGKILDNELNRKIWHYTNLQPLWQIDNAIKSNKYNGTDINTEIK